MRRRRNSDEWSGPLPWQTELLLVIPGIGGAAFAIWEIYDAVQSRLSMITEYFGVPFDVIGLLWQMRFPLALLALFAGLKWHFAARRWLCRKLSSV